MSQLDSLEIPDKTYFKIGEVSKLLDLEPYVLRYWEGEFDILEPDKTDSGQRIYQRDDIELIDQIRHLLYEEMFTIAGARRQLELRREGKPCYFSDRREGAGEVDEHRRELEAENAELRKRLERTAAELEQLRDSDQPDLWEERIATQARRIEQLEDDLERARETIADLESEQQDKAGVDRKLLGALRDEVEQLANLTERPV